VNIVAKGVATIIVCLMILLLGLKEWAEKMLEKRIRGAK